MGDNSDQSDITSRTRKPRNRGPLGLGDPDDRRLRKVEKNVLIEDRVRDVAKERCIDRIIAFETCVRDSGFLLPFKCRKENQDQLNCIKKWFYDKELIEQVTEEYLKERSEYRRTGIAVPRQKKFH